LSEDKKMVSYITYCELEESPDPKMTSAGIGQIKKLRKFFPQKPALVICGTGRRHQQIAEILGLTINIRDEHFGNPNIVITELSPEHVMLASGKNVPIVQYVPFPDISVWSHFRMLQDQTVICGDLYHIKAVLSCAPYSFPSHAKGVVYPFPFPQMATVYQIAMKPGRITGVQAFTASP